MMVQWEYHMTDHGSSLQISMMAIIMGIWGGLVYIYYHLSSSIYHCYHLWIMDPFLYQFHFSIFLHLSMDFFQEEMWHVLRRLQMQPPGGAESPRELVMAEMRLGRSMPKAEKRLLVTTSDWDWLVVWNSCLFSPIIGMMIQSDELIF